MVVTTDDDWVSEEGTMHVMSLAQEPHSLNEMEKTTQDEPQEPRLTAQPGTDTPNVPSEEPTDSADQRAAASLASQMTMENGQWVVYAAVAAIGLYAVSEVL